ncbi:MAG: glycosyltransferase family 4 protein [Acidimicrobiales bacterium]
MRSLLVAEQLRQRVPGGIGTYVRGLVQGLHRNGADVTLWASRAAGGAPDSVAALGVPVVTSPLPSKALVWAWGRGRGAAPSGYDVVHASSLAVPPGGEAPLAVTVHDLAWRRVPETFPPRGRRWHEAALGRALDRAALVVAPSRQTADDLLAAGAAAARVEVVDEGCDHLPPADLAGAAAFRAGVGVEGDYLLTVSTLEPRKNLPRLMAAYGAVRGRLPEPWPLLVVGPEGWGDALQPQGEVVLAGHVADGGVLAGLYAGARLVASVPLWEGFGLPAVEPMVVGTPVVASPQPSLGGAAYEVDPLDVEAIGAALLRVATDGPLRDDLAARGRARAAQLTWAATAARHAELWDALAGASKRGLRGPNAQR